MDKIQYFILHCKMIDSVNTPKTNTKKICKILNVLQINVYLFKRNCLCQQVYRSQKIFIRPEKLKHPSINHEIKAHIRYGNNN